MISQAEALGTDPIWVVHWSINDPKPYLLPPADWARRRPHGSAVEVRRRAAIPANLTSITKFLRSTPN
jgi:hypothetical protein